MALNPYIHDPAGTDLSGTDLPGSNLTGANLTDARRFAPGPAVRVPTPSPASPAGLPSLGILPWRASESQAGKLPWRQSLRIGDSERGKACDLLSTHYGAGRLDDREFEQRIEAAVAARTTTDLQHLFSDLPDLREASATTRQRSASPLRLVVSMTAWVTAVVAVMVCSMMVLGLGLYQPGLAPIALIGGILAATGGAALGWLFAQRTDSRGRHRA